MNKEGGGQVDKFTQIWIKLLAQHQSSTVTIGHACIDDRQIQVITLRLKWHIRSLTCAGLCLLPAYLTDREPPHPLYRLTHAWTSLFELLNSSWERHKGGNKKHQCLYSETGEQLRVLETLWSQKSNGREPRTTVLVTSWEAVFVWINIDGQGACGGVRRIVVSQCITAGSSGTSYSNVSQLGVDIGFHRTELSQQWLHKKAWRAFITVCAVKWKSFCAKCVTQMPLLMHLSQYNDCTMHYIFINSIWVSCIRIQYMTVDTLTECICVLSYRYLKLWRRLHWWKTVYKSLHWYV